MEQGPQDSEPDSQIVTSNQISYWESISPDVTGMLGGYPQVSRIDIQGSRNFIHKLRRLSSKTTGASKTSAPTASKPFSRALEPGAGIGRLTVDLLAPLCHTIDVIEPIEKFTTVLSSPESPLKQQSVLGTVYNTPLQSWTPPADSPAYDLIWNQWCLNHLALPDLVVYFRHCVEVLAEGGWIVVKENLSTDPFGNDLFDQEDSSVTRSDQNWRRAFDEAGLKVVRTELQTGFPKELGLYPVKMYALKP